VPALVSAEQFALLQRRLASNRHGARRNTTHEYPLRCRVSCGLCRLNCTRRERRPRGGGEPVYRYHACLGKQNPTVSGREERCPARFIPVQQLDALVWEDLCQVLQHPERLAEALERARSGAWLPGDLRRRQGTLQQIRASVGRERERLLDAYLDGLLDRAVFARKEGELRERLADLTTQEREVLAQSRSAQEVRALAGPMTALCARLRTGLETATFAQRRELVELLIDRVVVTDSELEIRYVIPLTEASTATPFGQLGADYLDPARCQYQAPARAVPARLVARSHRSGGALRRGSRACPAGMRQHRATLSTRSRGRPWQSP
jgi:site-specific DNA recombinase